MHKNWFNHFNYFGAHWEPHFQELSVIIPNSQYFEMLYNKYLNGLNEKKRIEISLFNEELNEKINCAGQFVDGKFIYSTDLDKLSILDEKLDRQIKIKNIKLK